MTPNNKSTKSETDIWILFAMVVMTGSLSFLIEMQNTATREKIEKLEKIVNSYQEKNLLIEQQQTQDLKSIRSWLHLNLDNGER